MGDQPVIFSEGVRVYVYRDPLRPFMNERLAKVVDIATGLEVKGVVATHITTELAGSYRLYERSKRVVTAKLEIELFGTTAEVVDANAVIDTDGRLVGRAELGPGAISVGPGEVARLYDNEDGDWDE